MKGDKKMQTVREFTGHLWYTANIIIVDCKTFASDWNIDEIKKNALWQGKNNQLLSCTADKICEKTVGAFGVMDNYLIIEAY